MTTVLYWGHHVQVCCPYVYISPARHEKPPHWGDGLIQCLAEGLRRGGSERCPRRCTQRHTR